MATTRIPNWDINSFLPGERKDFSLTGTDLLIINPINSLYRNTVHRTNIETLIIRIRLVGYLVGWSASLRLDGNFNISFAASQPARMLISK